MSLHSTLRQGDTLYIGSVKIKSASKALISIDASKDIVIIHATGSRGHENSELNTKTIKE